MLSGDPVTPSDLLSAARGAWADAVTLGTEHGYRNAQATVLAPTGTISFMMDCDTTGIEPDIALVKYKQLAGGGILKMVNGTVPPVLRRLGYTNAQIDAIESFVDKHDTIEGAPELDPHPAVRRRLHRNVEGRVDIPMPDAWNAVYQRLVASPVETVREQLANYKRFRALTSEWVDLSLERARLQREAAR